MVAVHSWRFLSLVFRSWLIRTDVVCRRIHACVDHVLVGDHLCRCGYNLLSAAGAATKEVIPRSDYELLSSLVAEEKEKGIDLYVRLNSLSGATGFFTKIGITGLPLATIALSLIFTVLGLTQASGTKLFDLANLTLGAFLGSYVQRQVFTSQARPKTGTPSPEA